MLIWQPVRHACDVCSQSPAGAPGCGDGIALLGGGSHDDDEEEDYDNDDDLFVLLLSFSFLTAFRNTLSLNIFIQKSYICNGLVLHHHHHHHQPRTHISFIDTNIHSRSSTLSSTLAGQQRTRQDPP